jgi:hypothetical protein
MSWHSLLSFLLGAGGFASVMCFGCCTYLLGRVHRRDNSVEGGSSGADAAMPDSSTGEMIDPVCGMTIRRAGGGLGGAPGQDLLLRFTAVPR